MIKKTISRSKFWKKKLGFWNHLSNFGAENAYPKMDLWGSKKMPWQFVNNSKITSRESGKRLFWPPKWSKHGCKLLQKNAVCWAHFRYFSSNIALLGLKIYINCSPNSFRHWKKIRNNFLTDNFFSRQRAPPPPHQPHNKSVFFHVS